MKETPEVDALVKELRRAALTWDDTPFAQDLRSAATALESQAARIAELEQWQTTAQRTGLNRYERIKAAASKDFGSYDMALDDVLSQLTTLRNTQREREGAAATAAMVATLREFAACDLCGDPGDPPVIYSHNLRMWLDSAYPPLTTQEDDR